MVQLTVEEWRRAKNMSIEHVAKALSMAPVTYSTREAEPSKFTMGNAKALADLFGVAIENIIFLP